MWAALLCRLRWPQTSSAAWPLGWLLTRAWRLRRMMYPLLVWGMLRPCRWQGRLSNTCWWEGQYISCIISILICRYVQYLHSEKKHVDRTYLEAVLETCWKNSFDMSCQGVEQSLPAIQGMCQPVARCAQLICYNPAVGSKNGGVTPRCNSSLDAYKPKLSCWDFLNLPEVMEILLISSRATLASAQKISGSTCLHIPPKRNCRPNGVHSCWHGPYPSDQLDGVADISLICIYGS